MAAVRVRMAKAGTGFVLIVLLAIVAVASDHPVGAHASGVPAGAVRSVVWSLAAVAAVLLVASGTVIAAVLLREDVRRRNAQTALAPRPERRERWLLAIPAAALLAIAFLVVELAAHSHGAATGPLPLSARRLGAAPRAHGAAPAGGHSGPPAGGPPLWALAGAGALLLLLAALFAVLTWLDRRRMVSDRPFHGRADALRAAVDASLEELGGSAPPRAAVIRAYEQMRVALGDRGVRARPAEAPREYLARAEAVLGHGVREQGGARGEEAEGGVVAGPGAHLTALFEQARFSDHAIGEDVRADAVRTLRGLRERLREGGER